MNREKENVETKILFFFFLCFAFHHFEASSVVEVAECLWSSENVLSLSPYDESNYKVQTSG